MTTSVGIIKESGAMELVSEVDLTTGAVVKDHDAGGLEWTVLRDGDDQILASQTFRNSDGLGYRLLIEVLNWTGATGEAREGYHLDTADVEGLEDLDGLKGRREELIEALVSRKAEDIDYLLREDREDLFAVELYIVPTTVPDEVMVRCWGDDRVLEHKDPIRGWEDMVDGLHGYGLHVPVQVPEARGVVVEGELEALIVKVKAAAKPVPHLFGFYMDRPWNALGNTGWDVMKDARAWPSMHAEKKGAAGEEYQGKCGDCDDEKTLRRHVTIYDRQGAGLCEECLDSWHQCPDCGVLMPREPQSWAGYDFVRLQGQYLCADCATKRLNDRGFSGAVVGGTVLAIEDVSRLSLDLSKVHMRCWQHGDEIPGCLPSEWSCRWGQKPDGGQVAKYIAEAIEKAEPNEEFVFGSVEVSQFETTVGLYWRARQVTP